MKFVVGALQYLKGVFSTFQAHVLFAKQSPSKENAFCILTKEVS